MAFFSRGPAAIAGIIAAIIAAGEVVHRHSAVQRASRMSAGRAKMVLRS